MDTIDKELLSIIQYDFPLSKRPFQIIGEKVGISEEETLERVSRLKDEKVIRRLGGVFSSKELGYTSLLCAVKIPAAEIDQAAAFLNRYPGITHNYERNHDYNLWFTLITENSQVKDRIIKEIEEGIGYPVHQLPSLQTFKLRAVFKIPGKES